MQTLTMTLKRQVLRRDRRSEEEIRISGDHALLDFAPASSNSSVLAGASERRVAANSRLYGADRSSGAESVED